MLDFQLTLLNDFNVECKWNIRGGLHTFPRHEYSRLSPSLPLRAGGRHQHLIESRPSNRVEKSANNRICNRYFLLFKVGVCKIQFVPKLQLV